MSRKKEYSGYSTQKTKRVFVTLFLDDSTCNYYQLFNSMQTQWLNFAYIIHAGDYHTALDYEDYKLTHDGQEPEWQPGELKKPHVHMCLESTSQLQIGLLAKKLGISPDRKDLAHVVQKVDSWERCIQYLCHINDPDKVQYDTTPHLYNEESFFDGSFEQDNVEYSNIKFNTLITNNKAMCHKAYSLTNTMDKAKRIINYITLSETVITFSELCVWAINEQAYDELRRGQHLFSQLVREHNIMVKGGELY